MPGGSRLLVREGKCADLWDRSSSLFQLLPVPLGEVDVGRGRTFGSRDTVLVDFGFLLVRLPVTTAATASASAVTAASVSSLLVLLLVVRVVVLLLLLLLVVRDVGRVLSRLHVLVHDLVVALDLAQVVLPSLT